MVRSMTGFGRGIAASDELQITVEARSVNHRFLEVSIKAPKEIVELESKIKKMVSSKAFRGKIDLFVSFKYLQDTSKQVQMNWPLFHAYEQVKNEVAKKAAIHSDWTMAEILAIDQMLIVEEEFLPIEDIEVVLQQAVSQAVSTLVEMREREGQELKKVMVQLTNQLTEEMKTIQSFSSDAVVKYRERLTSRLQEFGQSEFLDDKILTEVALFAEKVDITEEIDRLGSHISQMFDTIERPEAIGRKLEFIVQEMHREMNTIGSKNQSSACSIAIVQAKMLLEKLREQVQNIE